MTFFRLSTRDNCMIALCAAVIAIMAQIVIPLPMGIPITLQTFAVALSAVVLGKKKGTIAVLIYLLTGAIGLPVFHNFTGGLQAFVSPTAGFLLSFPVMAWHIGHGTMFYKSNRLKYWLGFLTGILLNHIAGLAIFQILTGCTLPAAFTACVLPFLPTTIIQAVLASVIGIRIRRQLIFLTS